MTHPNAYRHIDAHPITSLRILMNTATSKHIFITSAYILTHSDACVTTSSAIIDAYKVSYQRSSKSTWRRKRWRMS